MLDHGIVAGAFGGFGGADQLIWSSLGMNALGTIRPSTTVPSENQAPNASVSGRRSMTQARLRS